MELIALLLALVLSGLAPSTGGQARFADWQASCVQRFGPRGEWLAWLLPVLAVALLSAWLSPLLAGLPVLVLHVAVLWWLLERGDTGLPGWRDVWERGDYEGAYVLAREQGWPVEGVDAPAQLPPAVAVGVLVHQAERWFAPLFWFALLGPAAALLLGLLWLAPGRGVRQLADALAWLPARLLVIVLALVGDFARVWPLLGGWQRSSRELLADAVTACLPVAPAGDDRALGLRQLHALEGLLSRARLAWLVMAALCLVLV